MKMAEYLLLHCKAEDAGIGELLDAVSSAADERIALALAASVGDAVMEATEVEATQGRYYSKGQVSLAQSMLVIDNVRALLCVEQKRLRQIAHAFSLARLLKWPRHWNACAKKRLTKNSWRTVPMAGTIGGRFNIMGNATKREGDRAGWKTAPQQSKRRRPKSLFAYVKKETAPASRLEYSGYDCYGYGRSCRGRSAASSATYLAPLPEDVVPTRRIVGDGWTTGDD